MKKGTKLSKKQKGFVKDYIETGNATEAVRKNYKIKSKNVTDVAKSIGSQNLTKPYIQKAIADALPDDLLAKKHLALLNKMEVITKNNVTSGKIDVIPTGEIDVFAVTKGLDMAYKLKGSYAPEKQVSLNFNFDEISAERKKIKNELKRIRKGMVSGNTKTV